MAERLLVLIPPSLTKSTGGRRVAKVGLFDAELNEARATVNEALAAFLARASTKELETVLNAKGPLLDRSLSATRLLASGDAPLTPAWRRYQGVVWSHLDPASLSAATRRRVLVPSGLYGLVTSEDPISDYRLRMNARLGSLGILANFWRPRVSAVLARHLPRTPIVNLLPQEHAASVDLAASGAQRRVIQVHFVAKDEQRAVGHDAKAVKGILTRHLLDEGLAGIDEMTWQGWRVRREQDHLYVTAPGTRSVA